MRMPVDQNLVLCEITGTGSYPGGAAAFYGPVVKLANGGKDIAPLPQNTLVDGNGFLNVEIVIAGTFTGAGTVSIDLVGDDVDDTTPTDVVQPLVKAVATDLTLGKTIRMSMSPGAVKKFNRLSITTTADVGAGARVFAYFC